MYMCLDNGGAARTGLFNAPFSERIFLMANRFKDITRKLAVILLNFKLS